MPDSLPMPVTTLTESQRVAILNLVRRAARAEILPRFRSLSETQIDTKQDDQDLVTDADRDAEAMIARGLARMFPGALIVGEENVSQNPEVLDKIASAELSFTIDPVDGTWNFARGLTTFGVILSACRFGQPVFGLLYDPITDDVITGATDGPAYYRQPRRARKELTTSVGGPLDRLQGYLPLNMLPKAKQAEMAATFPKFLRVCSLRCSCHEFRMLAQGHVDFVVSVNLTPWDHAAGALIVERAGGHVAMLDGSDYNAANRSGILLGAANKETWSNLRDAFAFLLNE